MSTYSFKLKPEDCGVGDCIDAEHVPDFHGPKMKFTPQQARSIPIDEKPTPFSSPSWVFQRVEYQNGAALIPAWKRIQ